MIFLKSNYTWTWFWKEGQYEGWIGAATMIGFIVALLVISWFTFIRRDFKNLEKEVEEMENKNSTTLKPIK